MEPSSKLIELVGKFRGGDKTVFEEIYSLSYPYLHACVIHVVKDDDAVQDMLQETYLEVCRNIGQLEKPENFLGWAATIANRKCYAFLKKKNAELLMYENEIDDHTISESISENEEFIPESLMESKDNQRMIMEIIDGLTDMQRLCVIGFYYSGLSQEEIAGVLDIPVNTVKSHLNRAKAKIKEAVVELDEKKGIRLYSLAPLMLLLLDTEAEACAVPHMSGELVMELGIGDAGKNGVSALGKAGRKLTAAKLCGIAAAVGVVVIAGIAWIVSSGRTEDDSAGIQNEETAQIQQDTGVQGTDLQQDTDTQNTAEMQGNPDNRESEERVEHGLQELFVLDDVYESYGNAYGGSIPVKKDGLWGAINYDHEVIVPFEYDGFYAAGDKMGNFILYKSTVTEETYDLSDLEMGTNTVTYETREYFLFDNQGNLLYQGEDEVRASGGMYITLTENEDGLTSRITYHSLDGTELVSELFGFDDARINGFYDGISNFYNSYGTDIYVDMGGAGGLGPFDDDKVPQIATVDLQGNLSWRDDPYYDIWWDRINESLTRVAGEESGAIANGAAAGSFSGRALLSTMNHGYYITGSDYIEPGYISVYSEEGDNTANIHYFFLSADGNGLITNNSGTFDEDNYYRGYYVDGVMFYNYGSSMVFVVGDKNILVDFSRNRNPGNETEDLNMDEVVTAVYDYIAMADEEYWLVQSGDRWGYIDHGGNEAAMFDDAGGFANGYALILEEGEAWLIDTDFNKLESLGAADSVASMGELFLVTVGDERHIYQY